MIEILIWLLAVTGSALVLTQSSITAPIRDGVEWLARFSETIKMMHDATKGTPEPLRVGPSMRVVGLLRRPLRLAAKLTACPMCSGFWLGAAWFAVLRETPIAWRSFGADGFRDAAWLAASGFAGSFASAVGVALWLVLGEAQATMQGWRYLNQPKDPP